VAALPSSVRHEHYQLPLLTSLPASSVGVSKARSAFFRIW